MDFAARIIDDFLPGIIFLITILATSWRAIGSAHLTHTLSV
jgi:hypothetical protein